MGKGEGNGNGLHATHRNISTTLTPIPSPLYPCLFRASLACVLGHLSPTPELVRSPLSPISVSVPIFTHASLQSAARISSAAWRLCLFVWFRLLGLLPAWRHRHHHHHHHLLQHRSNHLSSWFLHFRLITHLAKSKAINLNEFSAQ